MTPQKAFTRIQKEYGIENPTNIKLNVLWQTVALIAAVVAPDPEARKMLAENAKIWKACELQESKISNQARR